MAFEDMDLDDNEFDLDTDDSSGPEDSGNRTFYIVAGVIGGVMLLSLICLALYALVYAPQRRNQQATQAAAINAQNTQVAQAAVETGLAAKFTATPTRTPIPPTATASASPTLVIAAPTQGQVTPTIDRTATVSALLTEAASGRLTPTPTASSLPDTGFAEDVGIPAMVGLALLFVVIIFLARRLRTAS
ncbi:MAG: LPXTG cell wall anchor domain-containing protein [Anaerolineales bacterium]|nr:LPXTG cell wall anchor domain-containing protein [Anaerolineales bacterium]HUV27846.1 LPXTG cell wall anchor domain-containing protein [Anaerolineales bacterium]